MVAVMKDSVCLKWPVINRLAKKQVGRYLLNCIPWEVSSKHLGINPDSSCVLSL